MLGVCLDEDLRAVRKLYEEAFDDSKAFVDFYFADKCIPDRVVVSKENSQIIAMMHLNPFKVFLNENIYDVSYFVAIATAIEYRKKGYMKKLMSYTLNKLYNEGEVFSLLMPIDSRIYERYGFGFIEDNLKFDINSSTMMIKPSNESFIEASMDDLKTLVLHYNKYCKSFNLSTYRDEKSFERIFKELVTENGKILLFDKGYLMTYYDKEVLCVREIVANTKSVFDEMMTYLQKVSGYNKIIINDHTKSQVKYIIPNIEENKVYLKPFMMARIINVREFILRNKNLFYEDIVLKIVDPYIEENNHCYKIDALSVVIADELQYDIKLDVKTLTQLAFGYINEEESSFMGSLNHKKDNQKILIKEKQMVNFFNEYD